MNRFVELIKINLPKKNIGYFILVIVTSFTFSKFIYFQKSSYAKEQNIYDLIISMFSNHLVISYFLFPAYLVFIYNIGSKKEFYQYILIRFESSKKWFNINVMMIFLSSVAFTLFIVILCSLEGCLTIGFENKWSEYNLFLNSRKSPLIFDPSVFNYIISSINPLQYVILNILFIIFFFFNIGVIFFILNIIFKNKIWSFVILLLIKCINDVKYGYGNFIIKKLSFYNNIILLDNIGDINASLFYNPLIYWIIFSTLIYIIGITVIRKYDFKFGDDL